MSAVARLMSGVAVAEAQMVVTRETLNDARFDVRAATADDLSHRLADELVRHAPIEVTGHGIGELHSVTVCLLTPDRLAELLRLAVAAGARGEHP